MPLAPERLARLDTAAEGSDAATLGQEANKIRVAAEQLASPGVAECARSIEQAARRGDFAKVKQKLATLRIEIRSLEALTI